MANNDTSCEPMDVDLSTNSANNSILQQVYSRISPEPTESIEDCEVSRIGNYAETSSWAFKHEAWSVKKFHIIRKTEKSSFHNVFLYLTLIVMPLAIIVYCISDIRCNNDINLVKLKMKLSNRLYGQQEAIESYIEALRENEKRKILFFYGGTGVGKTFTSSLTFEDTWNSSNVYHYTMPSFGDTFSTETMLGLNICDSSVVVVDDLQQNDFHVKDKVTEIIKKSENLNKQITVILIYNCDVITKDFVKKCDNTFYNELSQAFDDVEAYKRFIEFKPLTEDVLRMCIEDELKGTRVNDLPFNNLLNNFNVSLDGCKGVYKKIKFLNML